MGIRNNGNGATGYNYNGGSRKSGKAELPVLEKIGNCEVVQFDGDRKEPTICLRYPDERGTILGARKIAAVLAEKEASQVFLDKYGEDKVVELAKTLAGMNKAELSKLLELASKKADALSATAGRVDPAAAGK
jgi:hypothetical protein